MFYPYLAGYVALYTGDYGTAIKELQNANQKDPFVLCLLAQTLREAGRQSACARLLREGNGDQHA